MTHAQRIDEPLERNFAPRRDGGEQVAHRDLAEALLLFELDLAVARFERENVGRLLDPALLEEQRDLLLAQALDIECAPRDEMNEVLDPLIRAGELAAAAGARALRAGRGLLAHHVGVERARAFFRKTIGLGVLGPLVEDDVHDLGDDVAGTLDDNGIADANVAAIAQRLAAAADALDVVLIVQRDVLNDDAADADRIELADRREGAGAPDLDLDVLEHRDGALGRELVRDRPARGARDKAKPLLPIDAVELVNDAIDVVVELGPLLL